MSMYLDVVGITGESINLKVPNWNQKIDDNTMGYDVSQKTSLEAGSGLIAGGAIFSPMQISKVMDRSTPYLWAKLCAGEPIATVTIRVSRTGGASGLYEAEKYILENRVRRALVGCLWSRGPSLSPPSLRSTGQWTSRAVSWRPRRPVGMFRRTWHTPPRTPRWVTRARSSVWPLHGSSSMPVN